MNPHRHTSWIFYNAHRRKEVQEIVEKRGHVKWWWQARTKKDRNQPHSSQCFHSTGNSTSSYRIIILFDFDFLNFVFWFCIMIRPFMQRNRLPRRLYVKTQQNPLSADLHPVPPLHISNNTFCESREAQEVGKYNNTRCTLLCHAQ